MPLGMEVGLGPGDFVLDYRLQKIVPRMHRKSGTHLFSSKIEKKFWGGAQPLFTAYLPPRRLRLWRLDPMAFDLGAFSSAPRLSPRTPDLAPHFHTPSAANVRSERATERKLQGAKVPGNEMARERKGQGAKAPGSESAREQFGQGVNRPGSYWPIRSRDRIGPGAKRLGNGKTAVSTNERQNEVAFQFKMHVI